MIYKQLKALAKICDRKAEPGQAVQSPVFGDDMCYATDTYVLVRVTGHTVSELCKGLKKPSQVPSVLIDGFSTRQIVKVDDISIAVSKQITPQTVNDFLEPPKIDMPVMCNSESLGKILKVYKAFNINPVISSTVEEFNNFIESYEDCTPVIADSSNLLKVINVYKAFGIDPTISSAIKGTTKFPYVYLSGENRNYEIKACIAGKRKR